MVVIKLISGLGNQLFQYVVGRQLSIMKGVSLKMDTSFFKDQVLRSFKLNNYNINALEASESELDNFMERYNSNSLRAKVQRKIESKLPKYKRRYFKEEQWWTYEPELFKVSSDVYLDGYWQHYKYFENIDPLIIRELTVKDSYDFSVNAIISEIQQGGVSVSVHVRRGDYVTDPQGQ